MTTASLPGALARVQWLSALGPSALAALARASRLVALERSSVLWRRGERAAAVAVIVSGRVDVVRVTRDGRRTLLRALGPGDSAGLSALGGSAHSADLVAGEDATVILVPVRALRATIEAHPDVVLGALAQLGETISKLSDELEEMRYMDLDERLSRLITRRARGLREIRTTHEELAQQVGATRENVSRALKRLERRRVIACHRGRIELFDR